MKILIVLDTFLVGGAEISMLRLANALVHKGNDVSIFVLRKDKIDNNLLKKLSDQVDVVLCSIPLLKLLIILDGIIFRLCIEFSFLRFLQRKKLYDYIDFFLPDIVQSNLFTSDLVVYPVCELKNIPWVTTIHGDYLGYKKIPRSKAARIQDFNKLVAHVDRTVSGVVYISDVQRKLLKKILSNSYKNNFHKILNGYDANALRPSVKGNVVENLSNDTFVIGMVSRGIPDKGWDVLIASFLEMDLPDSMLVLVGGGDYMDHLKLQFESERIIFTGNVIDVDRYISVFDIACLPTRYVSESLPTFIIECLAMSVPVIATNVGEIANMLNVNSDNPAGMTIEIESNREMIDSLSSVLLKLYNDPEELLRLKKGCTEAFNKFDMNVCVDNYLRFYGSVVFDRVNS